MQKEIQIQVNPALASNPERIKEVVANNLRIPVRDLNHVEIVKRSVDARKKTIKINLLIRAYIKEDFVGTDPKTT